MRDEADQDRERQGRRKPAGHDVSPDRVGASQHRISNGSAERRGQSEQPAAQRRVLGVVAEDRVDDLAVEEVPAPARSVADVVPPRPHVERLVDRQAGVGQGQDDRQARPGPPAPGPAGRRSRTVVKRGVGSSDRCFESGNRSRRAGHRCLSPESRGTIVTSSFDCGQR